MSEEQPSNDKKVSFPYPTMEVAIKDKFIKIGGVISAYRYLRRGYQELNWRKNWEARAKAKTIAEDTELAAELRRPSPSPSAAPPEVPVPPVSRKR